jgi:hypothetical protein
LFRLSQQGRPADSIQQKDREQIVESRQQIVNLISFLDKTDPLRGFFLDFVLASEGRHFLLFVIEGRECVCFVPKYSCEIRRGKGKGKGRRRRGDSRQQTGRPQTGRPQTAESRQKRAKRLLHLALGGHTDYIPVLELLHSHCHPMSTSVI